MTVKKVLVIGGGITGTTVSIALAQAGVQVDLIERSPQWFGVGHGITVHGNALRALKSIGVLDRALAKGVPFDRHRVRHADGSLLVDVATPHTGGEDLPSTMGTLRSDLQTILVDEVHRCGVKVRLDLTVHTLTDTGSQVDIVFSDDSTGSYDLVIGADGIKSETRKLLGIETSPAPTGMGIWRFVTDRTQDMDCAEVYYGGPRYKAGYAPISETKCYAYILDAPSDPSTDPRSGAQQVRDRSQGYGGAWDQLRAGITEETFVSYQPIEWLLVENPWYRGRTIIIGDAAHACPPLIAQGAAMCAEDAVLLAEYVTAPGTLGDALEAFMKRRMPRVQLVVDNSMKMVDWELHPDAPGADAPSLMSSSLAELTKPA